MIRDPLTGRPLGELGLADRSGRYAGHIDLERGVAIDLGDRAQEGKS